MPLFSFSSGPGRPVCRMDMTRFKLVPPSHELFDGFARDLAVEFAAPQLVKEERRGRDASWKVVSDKKPNRGTQLRRFYDELGLWVERTPSERELEANLAFVKMLNAKAAYALGRELVDEKFVAWLAAGLMQVPDPSKASHEALRNLHTLFEAVMGFYKLVGSD